MREYNRLGDRKELSRKYPNWKGPEEGFRPAKCEVCRDWERLIREFEQRRKEMAGRKKTTTSGTNLEPKRTKPFSERKNLRVQVNFKGWEEVWEALNRAAYEECRLIPQQVMYAVKFYLESCGYLAKKAVPGGNPLPASPLKGEERGPAGEAEK